MPWAIAQRVVQEAGPQPAPDRDHRDAPDAATRWSSTTAGPRSRTRRSPSWPRTVSPPSDRRRRLVTVPLSVDRRGFLLPRGRHRADGVQRCRSTCPAPGGAELVGRATRARLPRRRGCPTSPAGSRAVRSSSRPPSARPSTRSSGAATGAHARSPGDRRAVRRPAAGLRQRARGLPVLARSRDGRCRRGGATYDVRVTRRRRRLARHGGAPLTPRDPHVRPLTRPRNGRSSRATASACRRPPGPTCCRGRCTRASWERCWRSREAHRIERQRRPFRSSRSTSSAPPGSATIPAAGPSTPGGWTASRSSSSADRRLVARYMHAAGRRGLLQRRRAGTCSGAAPQWFSDPTHHDHVHAGFTT